MYIAISQTLNINSAIYIYAEHVITPTNMPVKKLMTKRLQVA